MHFSRILKRLLFSISYQRLVIFFSESVYEEFYLFQICFISVAMSLDYIFHICELDYEFLSHEQKKKEIIPLDKRKKKL